LEAIDRAITTGAPVQVCYSRLSDAGRREAIVAAETRSPNGTGFTTVVAPEPRAFAATASGSIPTGHSANGHAFPAVPSEALLAQFDRLDARRKS